MNRFFSRLWNFLWKRLSPWFTEESSGAGSPPPNPAPPEELESLRRHAASLCALASQSRLELAELVRKHAELEGQIKLKISDGEDAAARDLCSQVNMIEREMEALLPTHEAQRNAAETAVRLYRQKEEEWQRASATLRNAGRLERSAAHAEALQEAAIFSPTCLQEAPNEENLPLSPSLDPVAAAREALRRPPPVGEAERSPP